MAIANEHFDELPKSEQLQLFQAIQTALFPESREDIAQMVGDIREVDSAVGLPMSIAEVSLLSATVITALASDTFAKTAAKHSMI